MMSANEPLFQRKLHQVADATRSEGDFSLVTYNILCDQVVAKLPQSYLPLKMEEKLRTSDLRTSLRHVQMMKELQWLKGDIICLQEVDEFYFNFLVEELRPQGYDGIFKEHYEGSHGLATFFISKKFKMERTISYNFGEILAQFCDVSTCGPGDQDNDRIAQFTTFRMVETGEQVAIGNVHCMYRDWEEPDLLALQISLFLKQFYKFVSSHENGSVPWLFCGDFNIYPYFPMYELVADGKLSDENLERLNPAKYKYPQITEHNKEEVMDSYVLKNCKQHLSHPLHDIKSAYKSVMGKEPLFTHYNMDKYDSGFEITKGTLDYIWYSSDKLQVNAVLETVKEETIKPLTACPNKFFPSDHLSLKACFEFK